MLIRLVGPNHIPNGAFPKDQMDRYGVGKRRRAVFEGNRNLVSRSSSRERKGSLEPHFTRKARKRSFALVLWVATSKRG